MSGERAERTRIIDATPARVWAVVGDVTRMPEWSEELASVDILAGDGHTVGSRFRGNNASGARAWSMECVIDVYEEGFERVGKTGRLRALAEKKLLGDRTEHNIRNIDDSLAGLAALVEPTS